MAGGALMFQVPVELGLTRTRAGPTTPTASVPSPEQSPSSCSKSDKSRGEKIGFGNAVVSRRWVALVLPVAATFLSTPPLPVSARDDRQGCKVELRTLNGCGLGVSRYPDFVYNAEGGGGFGSAEKMPDGRWHVHFNASEVTIPAVGYKTTTLLGAPLPPPLRIDVVPDTLDGMVDRESGKVELTFQAKFFFSAGPVYRPPPLIVDTLLTTESTQGEFRGGHGSRLDSEGNCRLVGVARLAPIDDIFMSTFLSLPSECLANMRKVTEAGKDVNVQTEIILVKESLKIRFGRGLMRSYNRLYYAPQDASTYRISEFNNVWTIMYNWTLKRLILESQRMLRKSYIDHHYF